jgi:ABC-type Na+ efflux pump permease subunit
MRKIYRISLWEFKRYAFTKGWLISLFVIPVILFGIFHLQLFFKDQQDITMQYLVGVLDVTSSGKMTFSAPKLSEGKSQILFVKLDSQKRTPDQARELGFLMLRERRLDGVLIISQDENHPLQYYTQAFPGENFYSLLQSELVKAQIIDEKIVGPDGLNELIIMPEIKILRFDKQQLPFEFDPEIALRSITNYSLLFFLALSFIAGIVIRSFQEEKSNRLIEVLLSSASIFELTIGKFIAFVILALLQTVFWTVSTWFLGRWFGIPEFTTAELFAVLGCFAAGLIFFVALYLYIGARILKESSMQFVLTFLSLVIFLPMLFSQKLLFAGESGFINELGFLPIFTPATSLLQITAKSFNVFYLVQQNVLLLFWCIIFIIPLIRSSYNPFGMFGKATRKPGLKRGA